MIIEILRGRTEVIKAAQSLEESGVPTYWTPVAVAEVYAGLRSGEEPVTEAFFAERGEVALDMATGRRAGSYLSQFAASHGVELADALVAAAATTSGMMLWTRNRKHYPMPDLKLYSPQA